MTLYSFILAGGSFLFLIFSIYLFITRHGNHLLNRLLGFSFFAVFANHLVYWLIMTGNLVHFPFLLKLFAPISYAAPACFYLYVICFINDRTRLHRYEWLHFIPVVFAMIDILPWYFSSGINWEATTREIVASKNFFYTQKAGLVPTAYSNLIRPFLFLIYLFFSWRFVTIHGVFRKKNWLTVGNRWLIFLLLALTLAQVLNLWIALVRMSNTGSINFSIFILTHNLVLISVILFIIYQPLILYSYVFVSDMKFTSNVPKTDVQNSAIQSLPTLVEDESAHSSPVKKSSLSAAREAAYKEAILNYMETQKPYLKADFQISQLSQSLNIPAHHCSYVLNYLIGKNFRDWINGYRVNHFIQQYELKAETMTIEALASEAGFSNSATFYNAFKKEYIILPTDYFRQKKQRV